MLSGDSIDTIMDAAQARSLLFARAVVDPMAIGDLWPTSIRPGSDEEWVEEASRYWRELTTGQCRTASLMVTLNVWTDLRM